MKDLQEAIIKAILKNPDSFRAIPIQETMKETKERAKTMIIKVFLMEYYLDYVNNYLTVEKFAEDNGITKTEALTIIRIGKKYHNQLCRQEYFESLGIKKAGA